MAFGRGPRGKVSRLEERGPLTSLIVLSPETKALAQQREESASWNVALDLLRRGPRSRPTRRKYPNDADALIIINADQIWRLQKGYRADAYDVLAACRLNPA
jgi:hypothetical protein